MELETTGELAVELTNTGARFSAIELRLPEDLSEGDWARLGIKLFRTEQVMQWWIGDWAIFGAGNPDKTGWRKKGALLEFCNANGFDYGNARNKAWVSGSVHLALRRENVRWSLFQEVAPLAPKQQKRWLEKAIADQWTVSELRRNIRVANGEENALVSEGPTADFRGTMHYDALRAWILGKPDEFWDPGRAALWRDRLLELVNNITTRSVTMS